jgi:spore germination protein GerM
MTGRRALVAGALVAIVALLAWVLFVMLPRRYAPAAPGGSPSAAAGATAQTPAEPGRKIKAHLYYVSDDGMRLTGVEREVAYGATPAEQARQILEAQIAPVTAPLVSAVPPGTKVRAVFVTDNGRAYVDLSHDVVSAHPGGTIDELLTVYTIVDALTTNMPAVNAVQILVDGREVDTLAGHVDLRRPLVKNADWIQ